jgi:Ras-related protein Rab-8A
MHARTHTHTLPCPSIAPSFNNVQYWMENIQKHASPATRKLLVGNKIDAKGKKVRLFASPCCVPLLYALPLTLPIFLFPPPPHTQIATERGRAVAEQFGMRFTETSAFDGTNVREAFTGLGRDVVESMIASGLLASGAASGGGGAAPAASAAPKKECVIA